MCGLEGRSGLLLPKRQGPLRKGGPLMSPFPSPALCAPPRLVLRVVLRSPPLLQSIQYMFGGGRGEGGSGGGWGGDEGSGGGARIRPEARLGVEGQAKFGRARGREGLGARAGREDGLGSTRVDSVWPRPSAPPSPPAPLFRLPQQLTLFHIPSLHLRPMRKEGNLVVKLPRWK